MYTRPKDGFSNIFKKPDEASNIDKIRLKTETYVTAKIPARRWDIYAIENDWRVMLVDIGDTVPDKPDRSFITYVNGTSFRLYLRNLQRNLSNG